MGKINRLTGISLTSATAILLLAGCGGDSTKSANNHSSGNVTKVVQVKCSGINTCKGTAACVTATHACSGQNACKGQGWIKVTKADCEAKGGKVVSG